MYNIVYHNNSQTSTKEKRQEFMGQITIKANEDQLKAITTTEGPVLIIAGPGSGKTFTLVERVVYLIQEKDVNPENIMLVTFTDKAAAELTTRISNRLHELDIQFNLNEMYLGTFHSICLRWLDEYREHTRLKRNFIMMDQFDQQFFIYRRLQEFRGIENYELITNKGSYWRQSSELLKWINTLSEEIVQVDELLISGDPQLIALGNIYQKYHQMIDEENALDFSTIQLEALNLLKKHPAVLKEIQERIDYIMVDEYQDTNTIQERIVRILGGANPNLCVVGDDDQGLYRFRGATIRNILQFKESFPGGQCQQVSLSTNYRSTPEIIEFYSDWMDSQNWTENGQEFRYQKQIGPREEEFPSSASVIQVSQESEDWPEEVYQFLMDMRKQGKLTDWNQVAFLFYSIKHKFAVRLARYLEERGIPVYSPRSNQFFEREEIRLMIGALLFLFPQMEQLRTERNGYTPPIWSYYDDVCFRTFAEELRNPENRELRQWCANFAGIHRNLSKATDYSFLGLFYQLIQFPLFKQFLRAEDLNENLTDSMAMRNLGILSQILNKFEYLHQVTVLTPQNLERNLQRLFNSFFQFLKDGGINEYEDSRDYAPSGCVSFMTIHQAKGLEFPVVIVGSIQRSPRKQYTDLDVKLEGKYYSREPFEPLEKTKYYDFWRLFYTAFSRAQNLLAVTYPSVIPEKGSRKWPIPSKHFQSFVNELPTWRDKEFKPGLIDLETVKEVNLKEEYSFTSHITLFENCSEQYRFFKYLDFAPVRTGTILFGTLVHQTIEDIHKAVLEKKNHLLTEAQVEAWFNLNYAYLTKKEKQYLSPIVKNIALNQVTRYFQRYQGNWDHIIEAEVDVSLVKPEYILSGTIDLIRGEGNTVELVDFKSEKKPDVNDPTEREKLERYRQQLEVYAHIVEEREGIDVSAVHLYYTSVEGENPFITWDKNQTSIEDTVKTFDGIVERIEAKDFKIVNEPPVKTCRECDMRWYCRRVDNV